LLTRGPSDVAERQRTLEATIAWSYNLLDRTAQALFRRLCLFAGRFTLEDVDGVFVPDERPGDDVLDLLGSLVDKSLVTKEDVSGAACYRLHETIREYASLKLEEAAEAELLTERLLEHYRTTCLRLADGARYRIVEWLDREGNGHASVNYRLRLGRTELFVEPELINALNQRAVVAGNTTVTELDSFNPFTTAPVAGTNYKMSSKFGKARNSTDYALPRTYRVSFGVRF